MNRGIGFYYYTLLMGEELSSPFPKKIKLVSDRVSDLCRRVSIHENPFNIDSDGLQAMKKSFKLATKHVDEKLFNETLETFFIWASVNNVWIGTNIYDNKTTEKHYDDYQIGG